MRFHSTRRAALVAACVALIAKSSSAAETRTRHPVALKAGTETVTAVVLTNTHSRTFTDPSRPPMTPNQCDLAPKDPGVVWKVVLEGAAAVSPRDIGLVDEQGRAFQKICWTSSGTVYSLDKSGKRTGGGPQTEFLAAGPESPRRLTITIGGASASIVLAK